MMGEKEVPKEEVDVEQPTGGPKETAAFQDIEELPPKEAALEERKDEPKGESSAAVGANRHQRYIVLSIFLVGVVLSIVILTVAFVPRDSNKSQSTSGVSSGLADGDTGGTDSDPNNDEIILDDTTSDESFVWPHDESDIMVDPKLTVGLLDNGLKYMIYPQPWPTGKVSMRFHVSAGSLQEDDDQLGLAHFLEHMLFNGLRNFPGNDVIEVMQRAGLAIGPHINAFTSFDETEYSLEAPNNETQTMDLCFLVMRDWLDGALLEEQAIEDERGVVLSELRGSEGARDRLDRKVVDFLLPDTRLSQRWPIGTRESLEAIAREEFVEFYQDYYTPKRTTVIVAGDIDVNTMEERIKVSFENATNPDIPGADPDLGSYTPGLGFRSAAFAEDEFIYNELYIYTVRNLDINPENTKTRRDYLSSLIAHSVMAFRLDLLSQQVNSPISWGFAGRTSLLSFEYSFVTVDPIDGRLDEAVRLLESEFRRLLEYGITQSEFDVEKAWIVNLFESAVQGTDTQESSSIASQLSYSINTKEVFSSPEEDLRIVNEIFEQLTPELVHSDFVEYWDTDDISLIYLSAIVDANTTQVLEMAYNESTLTSVDPPANATNLTFAYTDFGEPGTVVSAVLIEDLDIIQYILSNNVRVNIKKTDFEANSIVMSARFGSGQLSQPKNATDLDIFASMVMNFGGLGNHSSDDLTRIMSGKSVGAYFSVYSDFFAFEGETDPEDLELQLQLLAAHFVDPGYREEAVRIYRNYIPAFLSDIKYTLSGPMLELQQFLKSGDERYAIPTEEQMMSWEADSVRAWIGPQLDTSYIELSIVGAVPNSTLDFVSQTFGALSPRATAPDISGYDNELVFPETPQSVTFFYDSQEQQAEVDLAFEILSITKNTTNETAHMTILSYIFDNRMFDEIREELGAAYSVGAYDNPYVGFDHGEFYAFALVSPENTTSVGERIKEIASSIAQDGVAEDELLRATQPLLSDLKEGESNNYYWLYVVVDGSQAYPYFLDAAREYSDVLGSVSVNDINSLASMYLTVDKSILATMLPVDVEGNGTSVAVDTGEPPVGRRRRHRQRMLRKGGDNKQHWQSFRSSFIR